MDGMLYIFRFNVDYGKEKLLHITDNLPQNIN